jgi:lipoyl(octanoyl) transferase
MPWRLLIDPPASGAVNMATDEALMGRARATGEWVLRVYGWARPTLSLGRNQPARGLYDVRSLRERGVDIVRRPTGGRAVLHHREVTYSVTGPAAAAGSLAESYARVNRLLVDGLRRLGVNATLATPVGSAPIPSDAPCFDTPTKGELVSSGRKLVGSAQWRDREALLQHGSILVDDDQGIVAALLRRSAPPPPVPATLRALLGRAPTLEEVGCALGAALATLEGDVITMLEIDAEMQRAIACAAARYADDAWTWRR